MFVRIQRNNLILVCIFGSLGNLGCWDLPPFIQEADDTSPDGGDAEGIVGEDEKGERIGGNSMENTFECTGEICIVSGTFTSDMRWTADRLYILRSGVFIGNGEDETTLVIDPGTEIHGESGTTGFLVIQRNSKIEARGTPKKPIVFTSDKPRGARSRGNWGGVIINGNAPINGCGEPTCEAWGEGGTGWYGGANPDDNSGTLRYVRIEFAGKQLGPDNELNGLALQGVGSKTDISYLHLHMNKDDAIEFFGGTASIKYVLATGTGDDNLDWTQGWQGRAQFFVAQQYFDAGDNGIEADNNGLDNGALPISNPYVANFTLIGVPDSETSDLGILLREGTEGTLANGVVLGFGDACLDVDHPLTWQRLEENLLNLDGVILDCAVAFNDNYKETDPQGASLQEFFEGGQQNLVGDPGLEDPLERETPRFAPLPGSPSFSGPVQLPPEPFFQQVTFRGGVDPDDDWISKGIAEGWIYFYAL